MMRWLHLSNLGFGNETAVMMDMREKLLKLAGSVPPVDCLFVTGNIWDNGIGGLEQYREEAETYLREVQNGFRISRKRTFLVPGNQDVKYGKILQSALREESGRYRADDGRIDPDILEEIWKKSRQDYLKLYAAVCGHEKTNWHEAAVLDECNLLCLDTAILCGGQAEPADLIVGRELFNRAFKALDTSRPGIVLACHDFPLLRDSEAEWLETALKDRGTVLYLCGMTDRALVRIQAETRNFQPLHVFAGRRTRDQRADTPQIEVYMGEFSSDGTGYVEGYQWERQTQCWMPDNKIAYHQTGKTGNQYYFSVERPSGTLKFGVMPSASAISTSVSAKGQAVSDRLDIRDFFISYNNDHDGEQAAWIARTLRENGFTVYFQADDCKPGMVFPQWMAEAIAHSRGFLAVWSSAYENAPYCQDELNAAYVKKHRDSRFLLLPLRVEDVQVHNPLFAGVVRVDLLSHDEVKNRLKLLKAAEQIR